MRLTTFAFALLLATSATATETIHAVRYSAYGPASVLSWDAIAKPVPRAGEVLVHVRAAGVNPIDWKLRSGRFGQAAPTAPVIPGFDLAGDVAALGAGVDGYAVGDAVFAVIDDQGAYTEYAVVPAKQLVRKPARASYAEVAAIPTAGLTALQAVDALALKPGETVVIQGGSGGVGHFAVQLAKLRGARVVAVASGANEQFVRGLGADEFVDYREQAVEDVVKDADAVLDAVGGDTLAHSYQLLKEGGRILSVAGRMDQAKLAARKLQGRTLGMDGNADDLQRLADLVAAGKLHVEVAKTLPLAEARAAHEESETGHARGKIVLVTDAEAR
ncbi:MAG TPA: NADP-dependent oxidoreductase [Xanthomonadales bacterium]|nr:NADP-dependent oxidoreductase [Xanthomonadales bacterium]